jgi:GNAT superfamily N-acetyltransferase
VPVALSVGGSNGVSEGIRVATTADAGAITALVNAAFRVEDFFKAGDRTTLDEVRRLLRSGQFLVVDAEPGPPGRRKLACAYLELRGTCAYFGMLSIDPAVQARGLGTRLIEDIEARSRAAGCGEVEIHVVNLRQDLFPFYGRLGYRQVGTLPYPDDGSATRPCHFVVMRKALG